ncbi:MAG TPA: DUF2231 domain-containing protein [Pyrinomonadaceae bacterium]
MFPPIPSWDAVHPLIVHFPIALLLVAPILIIVGMLLPRQRLGLFIAALGLIAMGTIGTYVAVATGEATAELAKTTPGIAAILEAHEELAETTRLIFTVLTVIFAAILFAPLLFKRKLGPKSSLVLIVAFLLLYSAGSLVLINVAHEGGRLVHEFGVRAMVTTNATSAKQIPETNKQEKKHDDDH